MHGDPPNVVSTRKVQYLEALNLLFEEVFQSHQYAHYQALHSAVWSKGIPSLPCGWTLLLAEGMLQCFWENPFHSCLHKERNTKIDCIRDLPFSIIHVRCIQSTVLLSLSCIKASRAYELRYFHFYTTTLFLVGI